MLCEDLACLGITLEDVEDNNIKVIDGQREFVICCPKEDRTSVCDCPRASVPDIVMAYTGKAIGHHKTGLDYYNGHNVVHDTMGLLNVARKIQDTGELYTLDFISSFGKTKTAIQNKNKAAAVQGLHVGFIPKFKSEVDTVSESKRIKLKKVIKVTDSLATIERITGKSKSKELEHEEPLSLPKQVWAEEYGFINEQREFEEAEDMQEDESDPESEW